MVSVKNRWKKFTGRMRFVIRHDANPDLEMRGYSSSQVRPDAVGFLLLMLWFMASSLDRQRPRFGPRQRRGDDNRLQALRCPSPQSDSTIDGYCPQLPHWDKENLTRRPGRSATGGLKRKYLPACHVSKAAVDGCASCASPSNREEAVQGAQSASSLKQRVQRPVTEGGTVQLCCSRKSVGERKKLCRPERAVPSSDGTAKKERQISMLAALP
jgi:hypothetical protein